MGGGGSLSGVAGGGVCVVSEEGRGSGGCAPGKIFHFPPQNNGVLLDFVCKKDYKTEKPLPDERLKTFKKNRAFGRRIDEAQNVRQLLE